MMSSKRRTFLQALLQPNHASKAPPLTIKYAGEKKCTLDSSIFTGRDSSVLEILSLRLDVYVFMTLAKGWWRKHTPI